MNLQNLDFTPLWITMKTGVAATFVSFFLGIFAARFVMGRKGKARAFWDGFLTMPQWYFRRLWQDTFCFVHSVQEDRLAVFWRTVLAFRQYIPGLAVCWRQRSSLFR